MLANLYSFCNNFWFVYAEVMKKLTDPLQILFPGSYDPIVCILKVSPSGLSFKYSNSP
jgi:hypothetical protein